MPYMDAQTYREREKRSRGTSEAGEFVFDGRKYYLMDEVQ